MIDCHAHVNTSTLICSTRSHLSLEILQFPLQLVPIGLLSASILLSSLVGHDPDVFLGSAGVSTIYVGGRCCHNISHFCAR